MVCEGLWIMKKAFRVALKMLFLLLMIAGLALVCAWAVLRLSSMASEGTTYIGALSAPAEINWSGNAVPAIRAANQRDAYRLLGWAHARDRLWQMETQRRLGQGRLAELLGPSALPMDIQMRTFGLYRLAEDDFAALDAETRADLSAYSQGVNAYLSEHSSLLPVEFLITGTHPEPWREADSLVWFRLIAFQLSGNYTEEALRAQLVRKVPDAAFRIFFPGAPTTAQGRLSGAGTSVDGWVAGLPASLGPSRASNMWIVNGAQTRSGKPLLANDPHLGYSVPILWYLASIETPQSRVSGATVPGVPFHVLGHNDHVAWGFTAGGGDLSDLFIESVDPANPARYLTERGSRAFEIRNERILIRGQPSQTVRVRYTLHGPVISDMDPRMSASVGQGKVVALAFTGFARGNRTSAALRGINSSENWGSFERALGNWMAPVMNIGYADTSGNIAMAVAGAVPQRKRPTDDFPADGASGVSDWMGITVPGALPRIVNPALNRIVNANDRVVAESYPTHVAYRFGPPFRSERIAQLLGSGDKFDVERFLSIQRDVRDNSSVRLLPYLRSIKSSDQDVVAMLSLLRSWSGDMQGSAPQPLIYAALSARIRSMLLRDLAGNNAYAITSVIGVDGGMEARLLEIERTDKRDAMLTAAAESVFRDLSAAYGRDPRNWRWQEAHSTQFQHQVLGGLPIVGRLFNVKVPSGGGDETINRSVSFTWDGVHFTGVSGPGYRAVYDLGDLSRSRFMIATGQSGDPVSPYFDDLVGKWSAGEAIPLPSRTEAGQRGRQVFLSKAPR